ncbi:MAG: RidA family protein [Bdellovibrionaceae bacterium]|jgi:2-iminobutanoate/2-iminopropanoate deaminase|nr:RidA family protein [Pseudobdellovibrionaceae bacterium]
MKKIIETSSAPAPVGPYSQAIEVNDFIYCSGQIPLDATSGALVLGDIQAQTEKVMQNISEVLKAADLNFSNVVKTAIFLTDMSDFTPMNQIYAKYFSENPPARSCVAVSSLPKGVNVEIEVIAHR